MFQKKEDFLIEKAKQEKVKCMKCGIEMYEREAFFMGTNDKGVEEYLCSKCETLHEKSKKPFTFDGATSALELWVMILKK